MSGVIGQASAEWAKRPADQSFLSLESLHAVVAGRRSRAKEMPGVYQELRTEVQDGKVRLVGSQGQPAGLNWWSFSQLSQRVGAPAAFMRELPPTLASQVLNNRLATRGEDAGKCKLLLDLSPTSVGIPGALTASVRAFTGPDYSRIWDDEITRRCMDVQAQGWHPAPITTLASGGKTRGLYASDKDVFVFMVDNERRIFESKPGGGLSRGFMVANSEVGDKSFWMLRFWYDFVCANHNVWGAEGLEEIRIRHVGNAGVRAWGEMELELKRYAEGSVAEDEAQIKRATLKELGQTKEEVLDFLFGMKKLGLSRSLLAAAYQKAEEHQDWYLGASPRSVWGIGSGITEVAKEEVYADRRVEVERAAGLVFEMAF